MIDKLCQCINQLNDIFLKLLNPVIQKQYLKKNTKRKIILNIEY